MADMLPGRPNADECNPYYGGYIRLVPEGDLIAFIERQGVEIAATLASFTEAQATWRPVAGEWDVREIVGHCADMERVFAYRAISIARNVPTPLPGVDQDEWMLAAPFAGRSLAEIVAEFVAVRGATLALLRSFDAAAWARRGVADGNPVSVRALGYIIAGHVQHHAADFPRHRAMGAAGTS